ncbi:MAG: sigma-70 family RNA polymerase sigma factor [Bacteroidales bacterium]|nr:sigma-70 family RNA polymerase sigma factor [Bacteroidales bacterium]MBN2763700.1 sigma-70 family RNA polymerase sigma factor [Bacteroidales bacterium]
MFLKIKRNHARVLPARDDSDEALIALYRKTKDMGIVGKLFERYTHLVYGVCLKYLKSEDRCKDAVMEIFEALFIKLASHDIQDFKSWLYSVARNHCLMEIRREGTSFRLKEKILYDSQQDGVESDQVAHLMEEEDDVVSDEVLLKALESLVPGQAVCVRMMYLENKTYKDIAGETGYSMNEVKSHIQNGKRNLKNYLLNLNDRKK